MFLVKLITALHKWRLKKLVFEMIIETSLEKNCN